MVLELQPIACALEQTGLQQRVFHTEDPTLANRFAEGRATGETPFVNLYDDADFA